MSVLRDLKRKAEPPSPLAGRLSVQSILFAMGDGTFMTASAVFFTQIVGLSAAQVGLGITISGIASFLVAVPAGKLADRIGAQQMWAIGAFGTAAMYLVWPFIGSLWSFLIMGVVMESINSAGGAGRNAYILNLLPRAERVKSQAYMYSALNVGFTIGAALGGIALAFNNDAIIRALPVVVAGVVVLNGYFITRLPKAHPAAADRADPDPAVPDPAVPDPASPARSVAKPEPETPPALRNFGFLSMSFCSGILNTNQVLLNIVIPLWLVEATDAPRVLLAWLFATNTVMCIFLPMAAARGISTVDTALKAVRISAFFFVISCVITLVTHDTAGWKTIFLVWLGHVTVTGAELFFAPAGWAFESELSDPDRRGEYQGVGNLGGTLGFVFAPALYTYLAMEQGTAGWLIIGGIVVIGAALMHPAARASQRFVVRHGLDPSR